MKGPWASLSLTVACSASVCKLQHSVNCCGRDRFRKAHAVRSAIEMNKYNTIQYNTTQHNIIQYNTKQHKNCLSEGVGLFKPNLPNWLHSVLAALLHKKRDTPGLVCPTAAAVETISVSRPGSQRKKNNFLLKRDNQAMAL